MVQREWTKTDKSSRLFTDPKTECDNKIHIHFQKQVLIMFASTADVSNLKILKALIK